MSSKRVIVGVNDLATIKPGLIAEWHPTKNAPFTPKDYTYGSHDKVWWFLPYDDPETGKHFDFEWPAEIKSRVRGNGCPFLSGREVWPGFNDLATKYPDLAKEWHPTKNDKLSPTQVTSKYGKKVWWYLPYDDPDTGKHFDFEWKAVVASRTDGSKCPYLTGKEVWPGFNDLATKNPDLAKEWHPTKNGDLTPDKVCSKAGRSVWWCLPYDDPNTGKHFDFEWPAKISNRANGEGCPFLSGRDVWEGFNDLATINPELAKEWHPTKNGKLTPRNVTANSNEYVWWYLPYDDPNTGKHFDFEWQDYICDRSRGNKCPYLTSHRVWPGFNDLATIRPDLAKEWHPTKNGVVKPQDVMTNSNQEVWWLLPYDDPNTGRHFEFEWQTEVYNRAMDKSCPVLSGQMVHKGFNDLATVNPKLAKEWHPTLNGALTPEDVTGGTDQEVYWLLPYDDPETGKHFDFVWEDSVGHRNREGRGCPYLPPGRVRVWKGFNDLATRNPELAKEWHPTKNGELTPEKVTIGYDQKVWWYLPYDDPKTGEHYEFEWPAYIYSRNSGVGCPFLSESRGEQYIRKYLKEHNISFEYEKNFDGLIGVGGGLLSYDFAIKGTNILVEYQGIQHYEAVDYFGGEEQLRIQREHDKRKREYALENGYQLIELNYQLYESYEAIANYLDKNLNA